MTDKTKPYMILGIVIAIMLVALSRIYCEQPTQETNQEEIIPQGAIGSSNKGGYIYRSDFIGSLNKLDTRAEK